MIKDWKLKPNSGQYDKGDRKAKAADRRARNEKSQRDYDKYCVDEDDLDLDASDLDDLYEDEDLQTQTNG